MFLNVGWEIKTYQVRMSHEQNNNLVCLALLLFSSLDELWRCSVYENTDFNLVNFIWGTLIKLRCKSTVLGSGHFWNLNWFICTSYSKVSINKLVQLLRGATIAITDDTENCLQNGLLWILHTCVYHKSCVLSSDEVSLVCFGATFMIQYLQSLMFLSQSNYRVYTFPI